MKKQSRKSRLKWKKDYIWAYAFVAAPIVGYLLFAAGPLISSIYYSMTNFDGYNPPQFIGMDNYVKLFTDDELFYQTVFNTFYAALGIPLNMAVSLLIAVGLSRKIKGEKIFRSIFFLPSICSVVAIGLLWKWLFNGEYGLLNVFLRDIGINNPPAWLIDKHWAMPSMIIHGVFNGLGFNMIMYIAALKNVPQIYYEAAEIDGAGTWRKFWNVTWPLISPTTFYILITGIIGAMQDFARFQVMTGGGPEFSTTTVVYYLWLNAWRYMKMGYASAISWIVGLVIMIITTVNFIGSKKWVHYE